MMCVCVVVVVVGVSVRAEARTDVASSRSQAHSMFRTEMAAYDLQALVRETQSRVRRDIAAASE